MNKLRDEAMKAFREDDCVKALVWTNAELSKNPEDAAVWNNQGAILMAMGDYDRALDSFNKSLEIDPERILTYCNRGHVYLHMLEFDKATIDYQACLKRNPEYSEAYAGILLVDKLKASMKPAGNKSIEECQLAYA